MNRGRPEIGVLLGIALGVSLLVAAFDDPKEWSVWLLVAYAAGYLAIGWIIGRFTWAIGAIGITAVPAIWGGIASAVVTGVREEWTYIPGFLSWTAAGLLLGAVQTRRLTHHSLFTERPLPKPSWDLVRDHIDGEQPIADSAGWFVGIDNAGIDHPCGAYLTDRALYIDVRPDVGLTGFETIRTPFDSWHRVGVSPNSAGQRRLVIVFDTTGSGAQEDARAIAVDLPAKTGSGFSDLVLETAARPPKPAAAPQPPDPPSPKTPEGWWPDPTGHHELRYWDGDEWTVHVSTGGTQSIDAV